MDSVEEFLLILSDLMDFVEGIVSFWLLIDLVAVILFEWSLRV